MLSRCQKAEVSLLCRSSCSTVLSLGLGVGPRQDIHVPHILCSIQNANKGRFGLLLSIFVVSGWDVFLQPACRSGFEGLGFWSRVAPI